MPGRRFPFRRSTILPSKVVCCRQAPASKVIARIGSYRGVPDVSADADPALGPAIAVTGGGQRYLVRPVGGTAAAAAIIYRLGRSPPTARHSTR